jgi:hypothetical protein
LSICDRLHERRPLPCSSWRGYPPAEVRPSSPPVANRPTSPGPTIGRWTAVTAVQRDSDDLRYETFYELPSAGERSSATGKAPAGEIKVMSAPVRSPQIARALALYRRGV